MKSTTKDARRQKVAANKKKRKSKSSKGKGKGTSRNKKKRSNDGKKSKSMQRSPSKRKLELLKKAKGEGSVEEDVENSKQPKKKRGKKGKKKDQDDALEVEPANTTPKVSDVPAKQRSPKAKAKGKAKAKAAPTAKAKARANKEANGKQEIAKDAGKTKRRKKQQDPTQQELYDEKIVEKLCKFARSVSDFSRDVKSAKFKSFVRTQLYDLEWTSLNIYWTRCGCGVTEIETGKDLNNFSFNSSEACESHRIACAVKCAELAATCLTCAYKFLCFPQGLHDLDYIVSACFSE